MSLDRRYWLLVYPHPNWEYHKMRRKENMKCEQWHLNCNGFVPEWGASSKILIRISSQTANNWLDQPKINLRL